MSRIAIVAALEREVNPLVRGWARESVEHGGKTFRLFLNDQAVVVCAGMGAAAARRATEAVLSKESPMLVASAGFARALNADQRVADIVIPAEVFDIAERKCFPTLFGEGQLCTSPQVVENSTPPPGLQLSGCKGVDMEAAGVAQVAMAHGLPFIAVKAISDEAHFKMPPVGAFIDPDGSFRNAAFFFHIALRPRTWRSVVELARNSAVAAEKLSATLQRLIQYKTVCGYDLNVELSRTGVGVMR